LYSQDTNDAVHEVIEFEIIRDPFGNHNIFEIVDKQISIKQNSKFSDKINKLDDVKSVTYENNTYSYNDGTWKLGNTEIEESLVGTLNNLRKQ
jgi:hypothetical protein